MNGRGCHVDAGSWARRAGNGLLSHCVCAVLVIADGRGRLSFWRVKYIRAFFRGKLINQRVYVGGAVFGVNGQTVHKRVLLIFGNLYAELGGAFEGIVYKPLDAVYGNLARNAGVYRGTERVNIGMRSLNAV